jgi:EmrB/QacA subfamily drug resistance transporter
MRMPWSRGPVFTPTVRVALTIAASLFMVLLDSTILHTSLPRIAAGLGVAPLDLSLAVTSYLLAAAAIMPASAWLAARYGARRCFLVALLLFVLASGACGLAQNLAQLVMARVAQGFGGGLLMPLGRLLVLRRADKAELMQATALVTWPALLAPVIGPALGGYITTAFDWRWNFWLNLPLGAIALWLSLRTLPRDEPGHPPPLDLPGAVMAAVCSVLLLGGLEWAAHAGTHLARWSGPLLLLALGGVLLLVTRRHLRRSPHPAVDLAPLRQRTFVVSTLYGGVPLSLALSATPFLLPLLFQVGMGMTAVQAGLLVLYYFLGNLTIKPLTTPVLRRYGFRRVMTVGSVAAGVAVAACGFVPAEGGTVATVVVLYLAGATRSMQLTATNTLMFADITGPQRGAASGLASVLQQVAMALGVAIAALFLAVSQLVHGGHAVSRADFTFAFVALGLVAAGSALAFAMLQPNDGAEVSGQQQRADG